MRELFSSRAHKVVQVLQAPSGVGKTTGAVEVLGDLLASGEWPGRDRACIVTDTLEKAAELHALLLARGCDPGRAALLVGRNPHNCVDFERCEVLGYNRHAPAELCARCERGQAGKCAYLAQRKAAESAAIVVAPKAALFHEADDLDAFSFVVVDEDLAGHLVGQIELTRERLDAWQAGMDEDPEAYPEDSPERVLVRALALAAGGIRYTRPVDPNQRLHPVPLRLREHLPSVAQHLGLTWQGFRDLVGDLYSAPAPKRGRMPFETPWDRTREGTLRGTVPLRAFRDLVAMLARELEDADRTDSRLWVRVEYPARAGDLPDGAKLPASVVAVAPRATLLDRLAGRRVVVLDATPDRWTLDRLFPGAVTYHEVAVREPVRVVQLTDCVHGNPANLPAIRRKVAALTGGDPARVTRKRVAEAAGLTRDDGCGWWGRDDRAHNEWEQVPALVLEGHYSPPPAEVRMLVEALRYDRPPEGPPASYDAYEATDREGRRAGAPDEADPDVSRYLADYWGRSVLQAIGRLRACRRREPVLVLLASRIPAPGVRVAELATTDAFLGRVRPGASEARRQALDTENARRRAEAEARITEAVRRVYTERGGLPSKAALAHLAGCSATTALARLQQFRAMDSAALRQHLGLTPAVQTDAVRTDSSTTSVCTGRVRPPDRPDPPPEKAPEPAPERAPEAPWRAPEYPIHANLVTKRPPRRAQPTRQLMAAYA